jgi:hypothetical protein
MVLVAAAKQKVIESFSHGLDPTHDSIASGEMYEVKVQSGKMLSIEYATADNRPSGILLSHAKWYVMLNKGWNNKIGAWTGKIRIIKRDDLLAALLDAIDAGIKPDIYPATPGPDVSPGARVIKIDPHTLKDDGWIGFDVELSEENGDTIYDLSEIIGYNKPAHLTEEAITRILEDINRRHYVY